MPPKRTRNAHIDLATKKKIIEELLAGNSTIETCKKFDVGMKYIHKLRLSQLYKKTEAKLFDEFLKPSTILMDVSKENVKLLGATNFVLNQQCDIILEKINKNPEYELTSKEFKIIETVQKISQPMLVRAMQVLMENAVGYQNNDNNVIEVKVLPKRIEEDAN